MFTSKAVLLVSNVVDGAIVSDSQVSQIIHVTHPTPTYRIKITSARYSMRTSRRRNEANITCVCPSC